EVSCLQHHRRLPIDLQTARPLEHRTETRLPEVTVADPPTPGTADRLRKDGARLQQGDDLGQRIRHIRTLAKMFRTFCHRKSRSMELRWTHERRRPHPHEDRPRHGMLLRLWPSDRAAVPRG